MFPVVFFTNVNVSSVRSSSHLEPADVSNELLRLQQLKHKLPFIFLLCQLKALFSFKALISWTDKTNYETIVT